MDVLSRGPRGERGGPSVLLLTALLTFWISETAAQIVFNPSTVQVKVGSTAQLIPSQITAKIQYYNWFRGSDTSASNLILGYLSGAISNGPKYTGRETGLPEGVLRIANVMKNYTGSYTIQMQLEAQSIQQGTVQLQVQGGASLHPPLVLLLGVILIPISIFL
ncbi:carcinoembryonic antigen-related cell adhesion molecule 4-like isoform X2 [Pleurodeles waltl]|uniref:carcinoembryonic antigen-related cell adhesion molecule 4-like isoform X2 n=1 Tax=Pleurodeles waltl TaxID=8319 RepID=UPI0037096D22